MNRLRPALTLSSCVTYSKLKPAALWLILTLGVPSMENPIGLKQLSPLADAAIGGLLVGTFMSLFYLPMSYVWASGKIK
jgi:multidrug efflux pump subunit AcrB